MGIAAGMALRGQSRQAKCKLPAHGNRLFIKVKSGYFSGFTCVGFFFSSLMTSKLFMKKGARAVCFGAVSRLPWHAANPLPSDLMAAAQPHSRQPELFSCWWKQPQPFRSPPPSSGAGSECFKSLLIPFSFSALPHLPPALSCAHRARLSVP